MKQLGDLSRQESMIQQLIDRGISDRRVLQALRMVPRQAFLPEPQRDQALSDRALPIGYGQTISQPYMVALMSQRLDVQPNHRVLEIGTGSGYQTAVLAQLAERVHTVERIKPLLDEAFERLLSLNLRNIRFKFADGTRGWLEDAPYDRLIITAGAPDVPRKLLLSHLTPDGLAVLPIGPIAQQRLVAVRRSEDELHASNICECRFVKLIGDEGWPEDFH